MTKHEKADTHASAVDNNIHSTSNSMSLSGSTASILNGSETNTSAHSTPRSTSQQRSPAQQSLDRDFGSSDSDAANPDDIQARVEKKRLEHEQQRAMQRKAFEQQMALLEQQQREEEQILLQQRQQIDSTSPSATSTPSTLAHEAEAPAPADSGDSHAAAAKVLPIAATAASHRFQSVPSSRQQSDDGRLVTDELATAVEAMSLASAAQQPNPAKPTAQRSLLSRALHNDGSEESATATKSYANAQSADGFTPVFNERFLFDDELDNEDSAFVKKYNLKGDDDKFPILVRGDNFGDVLSTNSNAIQLGSLSQSNHSNEAGDATSAHLSEWPQFTGVNADATTANRKSDGAGDTSSASLRGPPVAKSSPPHSVSGVSTPLRSATARQGAFPLPSPSPRLSQTGRSSPAVNVAFASAQGRQTNAPVSPTPGLGGLADASRPGAGSRFVNTSVGVQQPSNLKPHTASSGATFPSFNLSAFSGTPTGSDSPSRFGPYSPNSYDTSDPGRGSRPSSGLFDAFNPTAGANAPGSVFPADKYSMGLVGSDSHGKLGLGPHSAAGKHARKGELDATTQLEDLQGDIFALCKDQHGCRFLQKKLEETNPTHRDMIFSETFNHFAELMTDPFGNYLCQKLLEFCTDDQRNLIVESVAPELVTISLNMHGTRAVQKMIDFLSTSRQIHSIIVALSMNVVTLIKDLNGNHVIQKCLNRLGAEDNQFIYNAVAAHCVEVATHRHGCCVLQRCIDHASENQRVQLVAEITYNALALVQDPFGNYVVQYVLDLSIPRFTDAVVRQFVNNVCLLSVQKSSSNVIEKCIRVSEPGVRKQLIEELLNRPRLEKLLRDSFANYVVQTSLDYADPVQRMRLVECIKPILPVIRNTPYGKRIQSKLQRDNLDLGPPNGVPYSVLQAAHQQQMQAMAAMAGHRPGGDYMGLNTYAPGHAPHQGAPQNQQAPLPPHLQHHIYPGGPNHGGRPHMRNAGGGHLHGGLSPSGAGMMGGTHSLPAPNFGQAAGGPHPAYGMNGGFNANVPPPMGMQAGPPSASGFPNVGGGFGY